MRDNADGSLAGYFTDRAILVLLGTAVVLTTVVYFRWRPCTEFVGYYVAGRLGLNGQLDKAYQAEFIADATRAFNGGGCQFWFYPPPFGLLVSSLALLPFSVSYFAFISLSSMAFLVSLRRISRSRLVYHLSMISALPSILTTILVGQASLLNASLIATGSEAILARRKAGGVALGLLAVIKPHLAVGALLFCVFRRRWETIAVSCLVVAASATGATFAFGVAVWPAFLDGLQLSSRLLANEQLPLSRMVSVFATAYTLGVGVHVAFLLQGFVSILCAFGIFVACYLPWGDAKALGYALLLSFGFSPYVFCYDTTIVAISASLLLPTILKLANNFEKVVLLGLCWMMSGYGLLQRTVFGNDGLAHLSVGGLVYLPLVVMISLILFRDNTSPATQSA
jgi:Glycosyltransferase family 87